MKYYTRVICLIGIMMVCGSLRADIQVQGYLNNAALENLVTDPTCAIPANCPEGRIYWDSVLNKFRVWDGTIWGDVLFGTTAVPDPLLLNDGTALAPTFGFIDDVGTNTGMYRKAEDTIGFTTNGVERMAIGTSAISVIEPILGPDGAVGAPTFGSSTTPSSGMYFSGGVSPAFANTGALKFLIGTTLNRSYQNLQHADGLLTFPSVTFTSDSNLGLYRRAADHGGWAGSLILDSGAAGLTVPTQSNKKISLIAGSMNATSEITPMLAFGADDAELACPVGGCALVTLHGRADETYNDTTDGRMSLVINGKAALAGNNNSYNDMFTISSDGRTYTGSLGTAEAPAITFADDSNTGLSSATADVLTMSTGGAYRFSVDSNSINSIEPIFTHYGTAALPPYSFTSDQNTGIFHDANDRVSFATGGTRPALFDAAGLALVGGSAAAPSIRWYNDTNTGFYSGSADSIVATAGGVPILSINGDSDSLRITNDASSTNVELMFTGDARTNIRTNALEMHIKLDSDNDGVGTDVFLIEQGSGSDIFRADSTRTYVVRLNVTGGAELCFTATSGGFGYVRTCPGSSLRFKENVETMEDKYTVDNLRPVSFDYKDGMGPEHRQVGLIAEEVEKTIPELALYDSEDAPGQVRSVNYKHLTAILVKEIQGLKARVALLEEN